MPDVIVVGAGPAGRALTHRLLARDVTVTLVDPAPDRPWRSTYACWADEIPDWLDTDRTIDDVQMCSMIWFVITDEKTDQSDNGKLTNLLAGTAEQITDILKRYAEAGLDMPLLWPPFTDVPVSKTLDDLKRLTEEIMPKVDAG